MIEHLHCCVPAALARAESAGGGAAEVRYGDMQIEAERRRRRGICGNEYTEVKKLETQTVELLTFR